MVSQRQKKVQSLTSGCNARRIRDQRGVLAKRLLAESSVAPKKTNNTVVSKLIADRHLFWGELIFNCRYRIALPEELIAITETDL